MKAQGTIANCKLQIANCKLPGDNFQFSIFNFQFSIPPSAVRRPPSPVRRGISLMEVLISTFVMSIGLLGLAALIPVGRFAIVQTGKSDRAGACGRAGLRDVKVRRMLDYQYWSAAPQSPNLPFAIDPLGVANSMGNALGPLQRLYLTYTPNEEAAKQIFLWQDDKIFNVPDDPNLRTRAQYIQPNGTMDEPRTDTPAVTGYYSWLVTVVPSPAEANVTLAEKTQFTVSIVVCYDRNYNTDASKGDLGEVATTASPVGSAGQTVSPGGGSWQLGTRVKVKENDWIMLYSAGLPVQCKWYRVVAAGENPTQFVTLAGPDWTLVANQQTTAVIIDSVIGVYTSAMELDRDPLWTR